MTATLTDSAYDVVPISPAASSADGELRVRVCPLVAADNGGYVIDDSYQPQPWAVQRQVVLQYVKAAAIRASDMAKTYSGHHSDSLHRHPAHTPCLRCLMAAVAHRRTLAAVVLETMATVSEADEDWNNSVESNPNNTATRLRRLPISESTMEQLYGRFWGELLLTALRIEETDPALIRFVIKKFQQGHNLPVPVEQPETARAMLAGYHLGWIVALGACTDDEESRSGRFFAASRVACAMGYLAVGQAPAWVDHLAYPAL